MKIKVEKKSYDEVMALQRSKVKPKKPNILFRTLLKIVSMPDLRATNFKCNKIGMERLGKREPCLILMNHSSFIDLKIAESIFYPRPMNIVCTYDGFVGKKWLMRNLGCIPTNKFVFDLALVRAMKNCLTKLHSSVLMFPEAGYTFDGTTTTLPSNLGKLVKLLNVPVVVITTHGAFARQPLYNNLHTRNVNVTADVRYLISPDEIKEREATEIQNMIFECFSFDNFREQTESGTQITEANRAEGLNRVLYRCRQCGEEGHMLGRGITLECTKCKSRHELTSDGVLKNESTGETVHIPDWFNEQRAKIRERIIGGDYYFKDDVDIYMLVDTKKLYKVGSGVLKHSERGFELHGCDGKLSYIQKPLASYTLNSDFYWYEIGDVISIGNQDVLYYCFPKSGLDVVTKVRLATEEVYKLANKNRVAAVDSAVKKQAATVKA